MNFKLDKHVFDHQQQKELVINQRVAMCLRQKKYPTPENIRKDINSLIGDKRQNFLRLHGYWKEWKLKNGLQSLVYATHKAYVDICCHDAALGSLASQENFEEYFDHTVANTAQKDTIAYCSLTIGIYETVREIQKVRKDIRNDLITIQNQFSSDNLTIFIRELRNNLLHGAVVIPSWKIFYEKHSELPSGSMNYSKEELLSDGRWTKSRKFLRDIQEADIHIADLVGKHYKTVDKFYRSIQDLFARNVTPAERDFFEIEDSFKQSSKSQWVKIIVDQFGKDKDPYDYLHRFFNPADVRAIMRFPKHSKEQVDFVIGLRDAEYDVDDELREMLYRKFGVEKPLST